MKSKLGIFLSAHSLIERNIVCWILEETCFPRWFFQVSSVVRDGPGTCCSASERKCSQSPGLRVRCLPPPPLPPNSSHLVSGRKGSGFPSARQSLQTGSSWQVSVGAVPGAYGSWGLGAECVGRTSHPGGAVCASSHQLLPADSPAWREAALCVLCLSEGPTAPPPPERCGGGVGAGSWGTCRMPVPCSPHS